MSSTKNEVDLAYVTNAIRRQPLRFVPDSTRRRQTLRDHHRALPKDHLRMTNPVLTL